MADVKKVIVSDYSDGFAVDVFFKDGEKKIETFTFDHHDTHLGLKNLFQVMGVKDVVYQEVY